MRREKILIFFTALIFVIIIVNNLFMKFITKNLKWHLSQSLKRNAVFIKDLKIDFSPVTWSGIVGGYLENVYISAPYYQGKKITLEDVRITSRRLYFSWRNWFKVRRFKITRLEKALLSASVSEDILNHLRRLQYPRYNVTIRIAPGFIRLTYKINLYVKNVEVIYEGIPEISGDHLTIYPRRLLFSNLHIPEKLLNSYQEKLQINVAVSLLLPVKLKALKLSEGKIHLFWQEENTK